MTRKTKVLKPDTVLKNYWRNNEQFADFFNAVLFAGRQVIKPGELEELDTESSSVLEHREYAESIQAARDHIKIRKKSTVYGAELMMLAAEGQEHIHYAMPMRVMGYDYGTYKKQYDDNAQRYGSAGGLEEDEYLSRMKKSDKLIPVVTVVVYYGEKPWDGALSLREMLEIPKEFTGYVNDYRMHLVEARKNDLILHNIKNIDFFKLLEILLDRSSPPREARDRAIAYVKQRHVDRSVVMTVAGAANCKIDYMESEEREADMWTVFEATKAEGVAEGRAATILEMGLEFGFTEEDILKRLQSKLNISLQSAQEYMERFGKKK